MRTHLPAMSQHKQRLYIPAVQMLGEDRIPQDEKLFRYLYGEHRETHRLHAGSTRLITVHGEWIGSSSCLTYGTMGQLYPTSSFSSDQTRSALILLSQPEAHSEQPHAGLRSVLNPSHAGSVTRKHPASSSSIWVSGTVCSRTMLATSRRWTATTSSLMNGTCG